MEKFKVMRCYIYGWDNGFFDENEEPSLFDTIEDAEESIQEHLKDIESAISKGYMTEDSRESRDDFIIMKTSDRKIKINLEL